jgi:hypothetical protein
MPRMLSRCRIVYLACMPAKTRERQLQVALFTLHAQLQDRRKTFFSFLKTCFFLKKDKRKTT